MAKQLTIAQEVYLNRIVEQGVISMNKHLCGRRSEEKAVIVSRLRAQFRKNALRNLGWDEQNEE